MKPYSENKSLREHYVMFNCREQADCQHSLQCAGRGSNFPRFDESMVCLSPIFHVPLRPKPHIASLDMVVIVRSKSALKGSCCFLWTLYLTASPWEKYQQVSRADLMRMRLVCSTAGHHTETLQTTYKLPLDEPRRSDLMLAWPHINCSNKLGVSAC